MAPDMLERIFEPYFTTKPPGEGSGRGLAVVHGILAQHGGAMTVTSTPGQGTICTIYLPWYAEAVAAPPPRHEVGLPGGTERILFVDDEPAMAALGQEVLTRLGYQVVACHSSAEALALCRTAMPPFDLVMTDDTMPRLTGDALIRALRQLQPMALHRLVQHPRREGQNAFGYHAPPALQCRHSETPTRSCPSHSTIAPPVPAPRTRWRSRWPSHRR
jgi:CheY-like chemotaxis protein